ncbi:MAG: hypothetical protein KDK08_17285 [Rhizobiaceae bacterium]|nr:hypothetical protein [Rhizobiaceae bacterium]
MTDHLTKAESVTVTAIETSVPSLNEAREIIDRFHSMIHTRAVDDFNPWIEVASNSLVASFACGCLAPNVRACDFGFLY